MLKKITGGIIAIWLLLAFVYLTRLDAINKAWVVDVNLDGNKVSLGIFEVVDLMLDKGFWGLIFENIKRKTFINFDFAVWDYGSNFFYNAIVIGARIAVAVDVIGKFFFFFSRLPLKERLNTLAFSGFAVIFFWTNGFHPYTTPEVLNFHFFGGASVPMLPFESELEQMYQYYYRVGIKQYFLNVNFSFFEKFTFAFMFLWYAWKTHLLLFPVLSNVTFKDNYKASFTAAFTFLFFSLFAPYRLTDNGRDEAEMKELTIYQQTKLFNAIGIDLSGVLIKINNSLLVTNFRDSQSSWFKSIYRFIK